MIETYSVGLLANIQSRVHSSGSYFRLLDGNAVDVTFLSAGAVVGRALGMNSGFYARAVEGSIFDAVELVSTSAQTAKFLLGSAEAGAAGAVSVSGTVPVVLPVVAFAQTAPVVGIASGVLVAANTARKFLMVQNNGTTQTIFLNLAGAAAAAATGVRLPPGAALMLDVCTPSSAVNAIADATGAVVIVVEG